MLEKRPKIAARVQHGKNLIVVHQAKVKHNSIPCISDFTNQSTVFTDLQALVRSNCTQSFTLLELSTSCHVDLK